MVGVSTDLVALDAAQVEAAADPAQYVVLACERAKAWLADALEHGGIEEIVELKSQAEAIRVYSQQKQLGKDAELSAAEIVRRAERGIGLAIRKGQQAGEIASREDSRRNGKPVEVHGENFEKRSPREFFTGGKDMHETYALTDGVTDTQFEEAIAGGRAEGNLSRANVVRKVKANQEPRQADAVTARESEPAVPESVDRSPQAASRRRELMREWASQGWTSVQIGARLGIADDTIRRIARDDGISIPADVALGRGTRKSVDSNRIVRETVNSLEGLEISLELVHFDELDLSEIPNWTNSLAASIRVLNRLNKQLKELVQ